MHYDSELLKGQKPEYLLVCCSDSRVPKGEMVTEFKFVPGKVFTISNAGNCYLFNKETLYYGVIHLKVKVLAICGHNDCGMLKAVIKGSDKIPEIQKAIDFIKNEIFKDDLPTDDVNELAKENVHRQIEMLMEDRIIRQAFGNSLKEIRGYYYDFSSGFPEISLINSNGKRLHESE